MIRQTFPRVIFQRKNVDGVGHIAMYYTKEKFMAQSVLIGVDGSKYVGRTEIIRINRS